MFAWWATLSTAHDVSIVDVIAAGARLGEALSRAMSEVGHCIDCRTFTEQERCPICANPKRNEKACCMWWSSGGSAGDRVLGQYDGRYFVLMGHLSPLDGIGPDEIGLDVLDRTLDEEGWQEIILATNPTVEGEATAQFIAEMAKRRDIRVSRIAHGVPVGGERYVDGTTLALSFSGRRDI